MGKTLHQLAEGTTIRSWPLYIHFLISWTWSMSVLASTTQIGVSISTVRAGCGMWSGAHRDGFIVGIGPSKGPETDWWAHNHFQNGSDILFCETALCQATDYVPGWSVTKVWKQSYILGGLSCPSISQEACVKASLKHGGWKSQGQDGVFGLLRKGTMMEYLVHKCEGKWRIYHKLTGVLSSNQTQ